MAVTRSTWKDRQSRDNGPGRARARRRRESLLLAAALVIAVLASLLVLRAKEPELAAATAGLASGELLDLRRIDQPEDLLPRLDFFTDPGERSFVARRIWSRLTRLDAAAPENVGELAKIRLRAADLEGETLPTLARRFEERRRRSPGEAEPSIPLLEGSEFRRLKEGLVIRTPAELRSSLRFWGLAAALALLGVHLAWRWTAFAGDELLLPTVTVLVGLGLAVMIGVRDPVRDLLLARPYAQGVIAGCGLLLAASLLDLERSRLRRVSFLAIGAALVLSLLLIAFGSGPAGSDAKVNLLGFQPVEAIKILVVLFLAGYFFERWEMLRELRERRPAFAWLPRGWQVPRLAYIVPSIVSVAVVLAFFFLQRDLGPALVLALLFLALYGVARGRSAMVLVGLGILVAGFFVGYRLGVPRTVTGRIAMWLAPWDNPFAGGDHLAHSLWALAAGGASGTGLGLGDPEIVPAVHTDLVLTALGEELGLLGLVAVFALYALLIARCLRAARRASGSYSFFLTLGLALVIALQVLLIAGGILGLLPLSGVVTPFLSYGRSAMLANLLALGLVAAVSARPGTGAAVERFAPSVRWVALALAAALVAVVGKAAWVQLVRADPILTRGSLALQADGLRRFRYNPRLVEIAGTIPRGTIVDRNGLPLATSDPAELMAHREAYDRLGVVVGEGAAPGRERLYPFGGRSFHLLGDLDSRVRWAAPNASFAERDSQVRLRGYDDYATMVPVRQPGSDEPVRLARRDYRELVPLLRHRHDPEHPQVERILGRDRTLHLSIDARFQRRVETALEKHIRAAGRERGVAVVIDAERGDLLASVSYPWPRRRPRAGDDTPEEALLDRARYGVYPPGSTFKLVTAAAALRKDPTLVEETFDCEALGGGRVGHAVRGWGRPIRDDPLVTVPHGRVDLRKGIVVSCNAYFAQLVTYEVGAPALLETAALFGIEVARPNTPEQLGDALPQAGYGQGQVIATPFEMARVAAAIAAGGQLPQGRWVIDGSNDRTEPPRAVLSTAQAELLAESMRRVVTVGSARRELAEVTPPIAGKTGTAEVEGRPSHSWFIGFAPYGQPGRKLAFTVLVENGGYGGRAAARTAAEIVGEAAALGLFDEEEVAQDE